MARRFFANNAFATLVGTLGTSGTVFTVSGDNVDNFPTPTASDLVFITLQAEDDSLEIMQLVDRTGTTFTVVRAQEGTAPMTFLAGALVELRTTAGALNKFAQLDSDENVAGAWAFQALPTVPLAPTLDAHAAAKKYVDDSVLAQQNALADVVGVPVNQAAHGFSDVGAPIFFDGVQWKPATAATLKTSAMALVSEISDVDNFRYAQFGTVFPVVAWALSPGEVYYVDPAGSGQLTATEPSTPGQWSSPVAVALASDTLLVNILRPLEVT